MNGYWQICFYFVCLFSINANYNLIHHIHQNLKVFGNTATSVRDIVVACLCVLSDVFCIFLLVNQRLFSFHKLRNLSE